MEPWKECAEELTDALSLDAPPIAVSMVEDADLAASFSGRVAAGCVFWQEATERTFVTSTDDHSGCAIGIHTHNMAAPPEAHHADLTATLGAMTGLGYVREEEVAQIPVIDREVSHVMYGPLAEHPVAPDVVMIFANSQQGLIVTEAAARVDHGTPPAMGRPACAVISHVLIRGRAALSLGCCGARAYLDQLPDSVALWAFPGARISSYSTAIAELARANSTLTTFHQLRRKDFESGERPTVEESLGRLGTS